MKIRTIFLVFVGVLSLSTLFHGQKNNLAPSIPRPDRSPNYLLRNSAVTARKLELLPGAAADVPASTHDYIVLALEPGTLTAVGGNFSLDLALGEGAIQVMLGGWPHRLINRGTDATQVMLVEVKRNIDPKSATCGLAASACRGVRFGKTENGEYSQTTLFETTTARLVRAELSPNGTLKLHDDREKHLILPLTEFEGQTESVQFKMAPGDLHWIDGPFSMLANVGSKDARFLILEVKE